MPFTNLKIHSRDNISFERGQTPLGKNLPERVRPLWQIKQLVVGPRQLLLFKEVCGGVCFVLLLSFISGCASLAHIKKSRPDIAVEGKIVFAKDTEIIVPKKSIPVGEKLTYMITWIGVPVGTITSHVKEVTEIKGRKAYHIELVAQTNALCSAIYKIDDKFVTYVDTSTLLPLRHELKRQEGRHRKNFIIEYDNENHIAIYHNLRENRTTTMAVPGGAQDPLSAFYFFRTIDVKLGNEIHMDINMNEKNYEAFAKIEKKTIVELPGLGVFDAFESEPIAKLDGKLVEKGRAWGYVSSDKNRIPLFGIVDVWVRLIGRVALTLKKVEYTS